MGLITEKPGFTSWQGKEIFLFFYAVGIGGLFDPSP
jgi:hypothetical protein